MKGAKRKAIVQFIGATEVEPTNVRGLDPDRSSVGLAIESAKCAGSIPGFQDLVAPLTAALAKHRLYRSHPGGSEHEIRIKTHCTKYIRCDGQWELLLNEIPSHLGDQSWILFQGCFYVIDELTSDWFLTQGTEAVVRDIPR